ncbi:MAG: hypothetical protein IKC70_04655, partial [Bacteroidaceae bacterium]|nr:hypothetical protein [Bacteroidaceae bacterium]
EMLNHLNVRIISPTEFRRMRDEYATFNPNTFNGIINPIDKILIYDENEMSGNILNERLRFDFTTLLPELSCNNIRHSKDKCYVPYYYCKNIKNNTHANDYFLYSTFKGTMMADEMFIYEMFDVSFRLPPVPPRVYEIRIAVNEMSHAGWSPNESVIQTYIDGKPYSIIDTRPPYNHPDIGWKEDAYTFDNGLENDKHMRNLGWMKAPDSYYTWDFTNGGHIPARENKTTLRKIITRMYLSEDEHWIRFKELNPLRDADADRFKSKNFIFDYIELVPLKIISDPSKPEDRH